jgi:hypothetical protein
MRPLLKRRIELGFFFFVTVEDVLARSEQQLAQALQWPLQVRCSNTIHRHLTDDRDGSVSVEQGRNSISMQTTKREEQATAGVNP